ncbi:sensor histidine kinase [Peribacillus glennii]|uniref:histidine kinase n=1 Tax=Peribacillus glennii TaxID=2303991 RepID=A0A372LA25_9BACI|nr:histidine kinase dimerization/phospho-acceptor domain-containing protein [Peribacillus glennii]RFU62444.1 GHKL domain-containing protein [Peribacillus glennii]
MDTKWKSRIIGAVWVVLFTAGICGLLTLLSQGSQFIGKDFFQSDEFDVEMNQFIDLLSLYELHDLTKQELREGITVSQEEIEEHRNRYGSLAEQVANIDGQYESMIQDALTAGNKEVANLYKEERDKKIEDITNNFKNDEHVRKKVIEEKKKNIDEFFRERDKYNAEFEGYKASFKYYLQNTKTGEEFTNLNGVDAESANKVMNNKEMLFIKKYSQSQGYLSTQGRYPYMRLPDDVVQQLNFSGGQTFEGTIAVPKSLSNEKQIMFRFQDYEKRKKFSYVFSCVGVLALLASLLMYRKTQPFRLVSSLNWGGHYGRIPLDVRIVAFILGLIFTSLSLGFISNVSYYESTNSFIDIFFALLLASVLLTATIIQGTLLFPVFKTGGLSKEELRGSLVYKTYRVFAQSFLNKSVAVQMCILLIVIFASGFGVGFLVYNEHLIVVYMILFVVVTVPCLFFLINRLAYFNTIIHNSSELAQGNFEPDLPVKGSSVFARLAGNINKIKHGVKSSQKAQAKSERLKTELITNVSHDLRTPLTSIISYTELLKTPDLTEEDRDAYVQIIDRKSKRLKILIEDLFEASKMASGNVELSKTKSDIVQLLQQALAEYDETIKESTLQFRVSTPDKPVYSFVDGQKVWRVFDNLIGNILKYSMEYTRVYINLEHENRYVKITFKNVTKYELGGNIDELMERFKRGDTSRHTDGSGLGLAIAKSIVDLHEGNMDVEVDGDLFKVTVELESM